MTEQLSLFTIHPVQVTKAVDDPYWDEITKPTVKVGDRVKLCPQWMKNQAAATAGKYKKDYQFKSENDLICRVLWVDPRNNGNISVDRNGYGLFVPAGNFTCALAGDNVEPISSCGLSNQETTGHSSERLGLVTPSFFTDKKSAPQHTDPTRWNPADFGEVPRKTDGDQLTIFYDDSNEPPDPDDYPNLVEYEQAWREWQSRVGEQVSHITETDTVKTRVGEQVITDTLKVAPQHDRQSTQYQAPQKVTHWIEQYWVERAGNKHWYYRYMWMSGRKMQRLYIGSVHSPKAQKKKQSVEDAIADGQTPPEIEQLIRSWRE